MQKLLLCLPVLLSCALADGPEDKAEGGAADLEHASVEDSDDRANRVPDKAGWQDHEISDPGKTLRDVDETRRKVQPSRNLPEQTVSLPERDAKLDNADVPEGDVKTRSPSVESSEHSELVKKPEEITRDAD